MSAIFGWLDPALAGGDSEALIERFRRVAPDGAASRPLTFVRLGGAMLAASEGPAPATVAVRDGVAVAVHGHPRWTSTRLAEIAREQGAAAALLAGYELHGHELPRQISGPCSMALIDAGQRTVLLAVDRLGVHTMCYAPLPDGFVFGSTADHAIGHPGLRAEINRQAVFDYFYRESIPSPETIFSGVYKLLPAERVTWRDGRVERRLYWQLEYATRPAGRTEDLEQEFLGRLRVATARAVEGNAEEDFGAFLSGGTDSSTIAGLLAERSTRPVDTYSIGFQAEGFDEIAYARIAARRFRCNAREYYVTPQDVVDAIPLIARAYDEPFGNASAVPTYCCARLALSYGKRVMVAGDGGDEIFGGNARYAKQKVFEWYWMLPERLRHGVLEPAALHTASGAGIAPLRKLRSYVMQARVPLPERLDAYNLVERDGAAAVFDADFLRDVDARRPAELAREAYFRASSESPVDRMMHLDLKQTLADNDLRKVGRMCERAGLEVRYPMLDDELVAFSGRLTPDQKVRGLRLRHFFKHALRDFLPPETISKTKHGFGLPFGVWMRSDPRLEDLARAAVTAFARRGWVRPDFTARLLAAHRDDHATYYGVMIWMVVMLEHWLAVRSR